MRWNRLSNFFYSESGLVFSSEEGQENGNWEEHMTKAVLFLKQEGHSFDEIANMTVPQLNMLCEHYNENYKSSPVEEKQEGKSFSEVFSSF